MSSNNTILLLGGGLIAAYFLTKKSPTKPKTKDSDKEKKEDEIYQIEVPKNSEEGDSDYPDYEKPSESNNEDPNETSKGSFGLIPGFVPNQNNQTVKPFQKPESNQGIGSGLDPYLPDPNIPKPPISLGGLKQVNVPAYKTIIVKAKPTPGYYYRPNSTDNYYPDPLLKIAVNAYGLLNVPENVILTYARQINKVPYNIRFQHVNSANYLPYNKRLDTSKIYGTLKQQFNDPAQGAIRAVKNGFEYPVIFIPPESDFF